MKGEKFKEFFGNEKKENDKSKKLNEKKIISKAMSFEK